MPDHRQDLARRRAAGLMFVAVVHLLAFLGYWFAAPIMPARRSEEIRNLALIKVFDRLIGPEPRAAKAKSAPKPRTAPPPTQQLDAEPSPIWAQIAVSHDVFKASDISRIPSRAAEGATASQGAADDGAAGQGEGPGGAPLYNAEWYREPTDAEMAYYLPKGMPRSGWGMVICKTVADNRVEDCRELGESPSGVGIARAVRQAAWQFRVRPPRIGGKPLIGAWVRIRFDMTVGFTK